MSDWKLPWEGGCRCGQVRMRMTVPPLMASACHCTGCQRMTASAFSLTLTFARASFQVIAGEPTLGGLHGASKHYYCPHCKSWLYTHPEGMDQFVNVRPTLLDDASWFSPFVEVYTQEKLSWASTPALHRFAAAPKPEEYPSLIEDYARRGARPG